MDEELVNIMSNAELDDAGKQEAIKALVNEKYVPAKVHSDEVKKLKTTLTTKETEFNAFKQTTMTEEQKREENAKLEQEKNKKNNSLLNQMVAESTFAKAGFKEEEYKDLLEDVIKDDYEQTKTFAERICQTLTKQKQAIEQKLKEELSKGAPKPPTGGDPIVKSTTDVDKYRTLYDDACKKGDYTNMAYFSRLMQEAIAKQK